jgi:hypothetical protein
LAFEFPAKQLEFIRHLGKGRGASSGNSQQDGFAMKFKKRSLAFGEGSDIDRPFSFHAHSLQGGLVRDGREDKSSGILKADKAAVKQMVNARGQ